MASTAPAKKRIDFKLHEKQAEVFYNPCRFRVVVAGRRFGKTKLSMLVMLAWATKKLQKIWYVAPTYRMAKQIMWNDLKSNVPMEWVSKIRENELSMEFRNGSVISLRGADKPDSLRGVSLDFLVLDEFQDIAPDTWTTVLRPTLADRKGNALFIGCVTGDTKVMTESGVCPIESFSQNEAPKTLTPLNVNLYGIDRSYHKADNFWNNGVVKTRKYSTHMGFKMESSLPHPIWAIDENGVEGWKKTEDLKIGDRVAIARGMEQWANQSIMLGWDKHYQDWYNNLPRKIKAKPAIKENADLAYFLGLWLAEGSYEEKSGRLTITCGDNVGDSLDERVFGIPFKQYAKRQDQWRINSYAVMEFMRYIKMPLCKAPQKRLPEWIWSCSRETAVEVLSGMWDGDGSIGIPSKHNYAYYATSSELMARDVQLLLTNFGIISRITRVVTKPTERAKSYSQEYMVTVHGANVAKLADVLKLRIGRKKERLEKMKGLISKRDGAPVKSLLLKLKENFKRKKLKSLEHAIDAATRTESDTTFETLENILEETKSASETKAYKVLKHIVDNHYYWDTITYIEESEAQTYDFTIPNTHSFWSNGFISHNTPKGYNGLYKLYRVGQNKAKQLKHEWMSWQFPTITSPFIPKAEIEAARRDMDEKMFRQEFCHLPDTKVLTADGEIPIASLEIGDKLFYMDRGEQKMCTLLDRRSVSTQTIIDATLETGEHVKASDGHKFKVTIDGVGVQIELKDAEWLEQTPVFFKPATDDEKKAALVAYCTGDGNIATKVDKYAKKDGTLSLYARVSASFYSDCADDLEQIKSDLRAVGWASNPSVTQKKSKAGAKNPFTHQLQLSESGANELIACGAPVGKKTAQVFEVPDWVMGGTLEVKRSYLAALFGAEGAFPNDKATKSHIGRQPCLSMTKLEGVDGETFFTQLQTLAKDFGVATNVTVVKTHNFGKTYVNYWLRVQTESIVDFYEKIGYVYCNNKAKAAWLMAKYIRTYEYAGYVKTQRIKKMREVDGLSFYRIGKTLGIGTGGVYNLYQRIMRGEQCNAGHGYPRFQEWISDRWNAEDNLLKLSVVEKNTLEKQEVFNITVDSPDHSYLLADGTNNYNCASFESMSGRVYYAFDRKSNVANVEFNPRLPIWVGMDFNIDPMSTVIFQPQPNGQLWAVDEIVQVSSNTDDICTELEKRYYKYQDRVIIYPDPAGSARQHARGESDLDIMREHGFKRIKVKRAHSAVADRVNAVNRMLRSASGEVRFFINPKCKHLIDSFEQTLYIAGSRDVDKSLGVEHSADAAGYCIELEFPLRKFTPIGFSR